MPHGVETSILNNKTGIKEIPTTEHGKVDFYKNSTVRPKHSDELRIKLRSHNLIEEYTIELYTYDRHDERTLQCFEHIKNM